MKAFQVRYDTAGSAGMVEILLVEGEQNIESALEAKSTKGFKPGNPYSKITQTKEIPLSKVKLAELSIVEYLWMTHNY